MAVGPNGGNPFQISKVALADGSHYDNRPALAEYQSKIEAAKREANARKLEFSRK